jgi:hypothetical protein
VVLFKLLNPPKPAKADVFPASPMFRPFCCQFWGIFQHFVIIDLLKTPASSGSSSSCQLSWVNSFPANRFLGVISDFPCVESEDSFKPELE